MNDWWRRSATGPQKQISELTEGEKKRLVELLNKEFDRMKKMSTELMSFVPTRFR